MTDCPANRICYNANVSNPSDVVGEMGNQTISSSATSAVLYAPNYSRADYGFAAWNTNPSGTGTNYGPNQTIEFAAGAYSAGGLKLYAKWKASTGNMQNWTCPNDTNMPIGTVTALKDTRDNNVYAVAKLADGKCWMIENLRLDNTPELTSSNTHNPSLPLTNIYDSSTTSNHLSPTSSVAYNATTAPEGWCDTVSAACYDQSRLRTDNTTLYTSNIASSYDATSSVYSYGNYYNWYSATAGHGTYSKTSGNAAGDICPAGWHLPTGNTSGEFSALDVAMGGTGASQSTTEASNRWRTYPNNFVYSGSVYGSSVNRRSSSGVYWSSSANISTYAYYLYFVSSFVDPGTSSLIKYNGWMVRCVVGV